MRSHLGESRTQVERGSVGEQKLRVRSVTTGCELALPTSILEGLDNVAIFAGEKETQKSSMAPRTTAGTSLISADITTCACIRGTWKRKVERQAVRAAKIAGLMEECYSGRDVASRRSATPAPPFWSGFGDGASFVHLKCGL